jgi:hypothetical protein
VLAQGHGFKHGLMAQVASFRAKGQTKCLFLFEAAHDNPYLPIKKIHRFGRDMPGYLRIVTALLGMLPTLALAATDAEVVTELASKCLTIPQDPTYRRASATFEVSYDASGKLVRIITVEFQPVRKAGEAFAVAAQDAIVQCAAQTRVQSRTIRVVLRYAEQSPDGPLIMKKPMR